MAETFDMRYQATDITRVRGDTFPFSFVIKDSDGVVVDISGFSFKLSMDPREEPTDEAEQVFKLVGVIPTGTDGVVTFTLSAGEADRAGEAGSPDPADHH